MITGGAQKFPHQNKIGEEDETEPTYSTVGAHEDWQHHQVIYRLSYFAGRFVFRHTSATCKKKLALFVFIFCFRIIEQYMPYHYVCHICVH